jgi:probable HAF family extracellular repeat protein
MHERQSKKLGICVVAVLLGSAGCAVQTDEPQELETVTPELRRNPPCFGPKAVTRYRVTELGTLAPPTAENAFISVQGLNERGQVAGISVFQAFLWKNGSIANLGTLGGSSSGAMGLNNAGVVVGSASLEGDTESHAFFWQAGSMHDIGTLGGRHSEARDINERMQIVGYSTVAEAETTFHAFLYDGGTMHDLGTLAGNSSFAIAINEFSQIAGYSDGPIGGVHAVLWQDGVVRDIAGQDQESHAWDINDWGQIVGDRGNKAFVYWAGRLTSIGPPDASTAALAINNFGVIVGYTSYEKPQRPDASGPEGFVSTWGRFEVLRDLVDSCWTILQPIDINDRGQIAAIAYPCEGALQRHALLLDPVRSCAHHGLQPSR